MARVMRVMKGIESFDMSMRNLRAGPLRMVGRKRFFLLLPAIVYLCTPEGRLYLPPLVHLIHIVAKKVAAEDWEGEDTRSAAEAILSARSFPGMPTWEGQ